MRKIKILLLLLLFTKISHAGCSKALIKYRENGKKINVYGCSFSGIHYIKVTNLKEGYSIFCELNKRKAIFILKNMGKGKVTEYQAITDSVGTKLIGFHDFDCEKSSVTTYRMRVSAVEIELLQLAIKKSIHPEAKEYSFDLTKILFFARCY